ncbi:hypothetical protein Tco_0648110 [Tanacetum coccineum]
MSNTSSIVFSICPSNDRNEELGAVSDASSTHYSTCQSNDSDGTRNLTDDCQSMMTPFHSKDSIRSAYTHTDKLESKNAKGLRQKAWQREAALKSKRVVHTNDRQATPAWNNINRVNKANQFTPSPVNVRPNLSIASSTIKTGRVNVNTGHENVNSDSVHVNAGTQVKSGTSN